MSAPQDRTPRRPARRISIYEGPTEEESLQAIGTSRQEIDRLAEAFGMPSGLDDDVPAQDRPSTEDAGQ